jgi:hypothetical protein
MKRARSCRLGFAEEKVGDEKEPAGTVAWRGADSLGPCGEREFSVWRLDDNANEFLVRGGLTRDEALRLVRDYEARGHKQAYWVRQGRD